MPKPLDLWCVWKVWYMYGARVREVGDRQPVLIKDKLRFEQAIKMADDLQEGIAIIDFEYGFCVKPQRGANELCPY